jgi:sodium-dependent dicarboxylate transporter 2/3/5
LGHDHPFRLGHVLGTLLSSTGLAETIGNGIANTFGFTSLLAVSAVAALIAIFISETTSNTRRRASSCPSSSR